MTVYDLCHAAGASTGRLHASFTALTVDFLEPYATRAGLMWSDVLFALYTSSNESASMFSHCLRVWMDEALDTLDVSDLVDRIVASTTTSVAHLREWCAIMRRSAPETRSAFFASLKAKYRNADLLMAAAEFTELEMQVEELRQCGLIP